MAGQALKLVKKTLRHMDAMQSGNQVGGILLAGDPGIGKTTFVKTLGKLVGLNTIVIEVPHITEEHLINIPFIVFSPNGNKVSGSTEVDQEYKLVLAQSNLFTQMTSAPFMSDDQYLEYMKKAPGHIQALYKQLGGTEDTIPEVIKHVRSQHKSILFLDEYYRQASIRIRNILRGILNGNLGMHKIPKDVYIMYASNMRDSGIDDIPSNHQFNMVEYKTPSKDDWFEYLISEYQAHNHIKVNMTVMNKFKQLLKDEHISYDDMMAEVRTSPRRWEQLIMYVNNAVPVESREEARALMSNVRNNFIHYQSGAYSELAEKVTSAVAELITETSDGKVTSFASDGLEDHEWRSALNHAIEAQIKAGGTRKYVPVVSGPPGIGKAQPLHSMIKTPSGWTTMGEIQVGDQIATPNGEVATVDGIFTQAPRMVYKVTFADGRTAEACAEHLWKVKKDRESAFRVIDTAEIRRLLDDTNRWVYVPLAAPVEQPDVEFTVSPYLIGSLLGDGGLTGTTISFSTADDQLVTQLNNELQQLECKLNHHANYDYVVVQANRNVPTAKCERGVYLNPLKVELGKLGVLGQNSYTKSIPSVYFSGSVAQKERLIAGLIDTDGYVNKQGSISFSTSSESLAKDVQQMIWSIGGMAKITTKIPSYTYKGERKDGAVSYSVSIRYHSPRNLVTLERKLARVPADYQYSNMSLRVVAVDEVSVQPVQCISVNHPDHLYITDNYVVTHNTSQAAAVALHHNLRLIELDVGEIYSEDAVGMAIPGARDGDKINVRFSVPKLHKQIMNIIHQKDEGYKNALKEEYGADEGAKKYKEYENQRWKYLIFFDELNRVDEKTFNALRKVILDKDFGPSGEKGGGNLELPKEAIVVAAINPEGVGTTELTSHFRDVIDIIPAKASWDNTKKWLSNKKFNNVPEAVTESALKLVNDFAEKFKSKQGHGVQQRPFYLDINGMEIYLSPREYNDLFSTMVRELNSVLLDFKGQDADPDEIREGLNEMAAEAFEDSLNMPFVKQGFEKDEFFETLKIWIERLPDTYFSDIITRVGSSGAESREEETLRSVLKKYLDGGDITKLPDDPMFVNANNVSNHAQFMEQVHELLTTELVEEQQVIDHIIKKEAPQITLVGDDLKYNDGTKTCLLDNFARAVVYSLHIHDFAHDRVQQMGRVISKSMSELMKTWKSSGKLTEDELDDAQSNVIDIRSDLHDIVSEL